MIYQLGLIIKSMKRIVFSGLIAYLLISCKFNNKELKESWWKFGEGYYIGDVLNFNNENLIIKNDTLFLNNKPKAIIITQTESFLGFTDRSIIIKSLESNEKGTYFQK